MRFECRTCTVRDGAEHLCHHVTTKFTEGGKPLAEPHDECPCCGGYNSKVAVPAEQKLWLMQDVNPNEYQTDKDGNRVMKDWAQGELEAKIGAPDPDDIETEEQARERKRAQAREVRATYGTSLPPDLAARIVEKINEGALLADAEAAGIVPMREAKREAPIVRP